MIREANLWSRSQDFDWWTESKRLHDPQNPIAIYPRQLFKAALLVDLNSSPVPASRNLFDGQGKDDFPTERFLYLLAGNSDRIKWEHFQIVVHALGEGPLFETRHQTPSRMDRLKPLLIGINDWFFGIRSDIQTRDDLLKSKCNEGDFALIITKDGFVLHIVNDMDIWLEHEPTRRNMVTWNKTKSGFMVFSDDKKFKPCGPYPSILLAVSDHCILTSSARFASTLSSHHFGRSVCTSMQDIPSSPSSAKSRSRLRPQPLCPSSFSTSPSSFSLVSSRVISSSAQSSPSSSPVLRSVSSVQISSSFPSLSHQLGGSPLHSVRRASSLHSSSSPSLSRRDSDSLWSSHSFESQSTLATDDLDDSGRLALMSDDS
jgi:hypothetical protein